MPKITIINHKSYKSIIFSENHESYVSLDDVINYLKNNGYDVNEDDDEMWIRNAQEEWDKYELIIYHDGDFEILAYKDGFGNVLLYET